MLSNSLVGEMYLFNFSKTSQSKILLSVTVLDLKKLILIFKKKNHFPDKVKSSFLVLVTHIQIFGRENIRVSF